MKKNFFVNTSFLIIFLLSISIHIKAQNLDLKKIDNYIKSAQKQWNIPGLAIAIVQNDKVIFSKGYGVREYGKKAKVTDKSLFAIASNTKAFTAAVLSFFMNCEAPHRK